ncbi:efflux RND transporter periplasmic adaptor subunit [Paenirhodobacter sp.]|uniref:efflux RND transporter periplasmic adaptor subunit n=1 Tax=Paenirhodobacter sp. TaxID=1965326 RepID=UPI003B3FD9DE
MIKRFIIAIIALAVIGGGIVGFNLFRAKMIAQFLAAMNSAAFPVTVTEVVPGTWAPGIEAIGTANAAQGSDLSTEASGIVREIRFAANDTVEQGQLLVQIDDRQERADLEAARATEDLAQITLRRARNLQQRGVQATSTLDSAEAEAVSARSTVAKLEAVLSMKQLNAPFAGTIGIPRVEVGQFVSAGTVYATLQDRSKMRVDFSLSEQQAALVKGGMAVTVIGEEDGTQVAGSIIGIDPKIDPNSRLVNLRAILPEANGHLTPGQFLRVRVHLPEEKDVIALPQTVVASSLYGDSVYVVREETPEGSDTAHLVARQVFVQLGRRSAGMIEITSGLKAGDKVVNAGQNRLSSGAPVTITTDAAATAN